MEEVVPSSSGSIKDVGVHAPVPINANKYNAANARVERNKDWSVTQLFRPAKSRPTREVSRRLNLHVRLPNLGELWVYLLCFCRKWLNKT